MSEPLVYLNDRFVPASQAHLNIYDLGIVLGATLTEMTRTFAHRPFRLEDHIGRLFRSCKYANLQPPLSPEEMRAKTHELIEANCKFIEAGQELGIIHFIYLGNSIIGLNIIVIGSITHNQKSCCCGRSCFSKPYFP